MVHKIYTGSRSQADELADLFVGDGCAVSTNEPVGRDFVLLEIEPTLRRP